MDSGARRGEPAPVDGAPRIRLPASTLERYRMFSLYNSPYAAHDDGRAVDLYPERGRGPAPSPVAGEVLDVRSVEAPSKPYAARQDHLILVDVDDADPVSVVGSREPDRVPDLVARVLHVDPAVSPGDRIERFDSLGTTIRSGFFAPWVADHLHVGFRDRSANLYRASGSLPLSVGPRVDPLAWDGTGTVVATGPTYAILDRPRHPAPGERFAGIAADGTDAVLDGGLPHYDGGGVVTAPETTPSRPSLLGVELGRSRTGGIDWGDVTVRVDGDPVVGLSLYAGRDRAGAKIVCPDLDLTTGDSVRVEIE